jgi:hypothetical protein
MRLFHGWRVNIAVAALAFVTAFAANTYLRGQTSSATTQMVSVEGRQMRVRSQGLDQRQAGKRWLSWRLARVAD